MLLKIAGLYDETKGLYYFTMTSWFVEIFESLFGNFYDWKTKKWIMKLNKKILGLWVQSNLYKFCFLCATVLPSIFSFSSLYLYKWSKMTFERSPSSHWGLIRHLTSNFGTVWPILKIQRAKQVRIWFPVDWTHCQYQILSETTRSTR